MTRDSCHALEDGYEGLSHCLPAIAALTKENKDAVKSWKWNKLSRTEQRKRKTTAAVKKAHVAVVSCKRNLANMKAILARMPNNPDAQQAVKDAAAKCQKRTAVEKAAAAKAATARRAAKAAAVAKKAAARQAKKLAAAKRHQAKKLAAAQRRAARKAAKVAKRAAAKKAAAARRVAAKKAAAARRAQESKAARAARRAAARVARKAAKAAARKAAAAKKALAAKVISCAGQRVNLFSSMMLAFTFYVTGL